MSSKSSSTRRVTASSAVSGAVVAINTPTGGVSVSGARITASTPISLGVVTAGQTAAASSVAASSAPTVTGFIITDSSYTNIDDTSFDPTGGYAKIIGTNFKTGAVAYINGVALSTAFISATELRVVIPAEAIGTYSLIVFNSDGSGGIYLGLNVSSLPAFTTNEGPLGSFYETNPISTTITATGDTPITYSLFSGALPAGATLSSTGTITGTSPIDSSSTTYPFVVKATDPQNQDSYRAFSITINTDAVTWNTPASDYSITTGNSAISPIVLDASSAAGKTISYAADSLPAGITLSNGTISGAATIAGTTSTVLTATADITGRSATRMISWTVALGDINWKYVSLLLNGNTGSPTFINDASNNNSQLTIVGDTRPNNFSPYEGEGYYSVSHAGTPDYLSIPHNSNFSVTSGMTDTLIVEGWFYFNAVTAQTTLFDKSGVNTVSFANWTVYLNASKQIQLQWGVSGTPGTSNVGTVNSTFVPDAGKWYHIAFVKSAADWAVFANGARIISYNGLNTAGDANPSALRIGYGIQGAANGAYFNGYISNVRAWRGTSGAPYSATSTTLTVPTGPLTAIAGTILLSHQSARFIDVSSAPATLTATGANLKVASVIPFANNTAASTYGSAYFDGTGDYLSIPNSSAFNLPGDFTMEAWVYPTAYPGSNNTVMSMWNVGLSFIFKVVAGNRISFYGYPGSTVGVVASSTTVDLNRWSHVAVTRVGSTVRLYVNGVQDAASVAMSGTLAGTTDTLNIGSLGTIELWNGYIADARIVKGTALYTGNFPLPTAPLTAISDTSLLTCQYNGGATNNAFLDQSGFNNTITRSGNVSQGTFSPYSHTGWSTYYNGTSDYQALPTNAAFAIGTADFTVEAWVMPTGPNLIWSQIFAGVSYGSSSDWGLYASDSNTPLYPTFYFTGSGTPGNGATQTQGSQTLTGYTKLVIGQWNHIAVSRASGTARMFINGNQTGPSLNASTWSLANSLQKSIGGGFNGNANTLFTGNISNLRVVSGTGLYTGNFNPSAEPLTAIPGTVLLTNQSPSFIDKSPSNFTLTTGGTPKNQALSPFGGVRTVPTSYSNYFSGSTDYLTLASSSSAYNFGAGVDFTIEAWVYPTALQGSSWGIIDARVNAATSAAWILHLVPSSGTYRLEFFNSGPNTGTAIIPLNRWTHVAVARAGTSLKTYVNGVLDMTVTGYGGAISPGTTAPRLGTGKDGSGTTFATTGYISNFRIVNGSALYTTASVTPGTVVFTPSTAPLTSTSQGAAASQVSLLTCQSSTMVDNSPNYFSMTAVGATKPLVFNPFGETNTTKVSYTRDVNGGSMYFDGNGDYLTVGTFAPRTANFTIDYWIYPTALPASGQQAVMFGTPFNTANFQMFLNNNSTIQWQAYSASSASMPIKINQWTHIAVTRVNSVGYLYINGVLANSAAMGTDINGVATVGSRSTSLYFTGYITDMRTTLGAVLYTSNFYPGYVPATPTQKLGTTIHSSNLLLNGTSGGIVDAHGSNNLETLGNTQLSALSPYSSATSGKSLYFDGTGDYLIADTVNRNQYTFGSSDFTIEMWVYFNNATTLAVLYDHRNGGNGSYPTLYVNSGLLYYYANSADMISKSVTTGQWYHVAVTRNSGTTRLFVNGTTTGTSAVNGVSDPYVYLNEANRPAIASSGMTIGTGLLNGYIKDLRVTKGVARYTTTFTPPTGTYETE